VTGTLTPVVAVELWVLAVLVELHLTTGVVTVAYVWLAGSVLLAAVLGFVLARRERA
jgi:hypothetical protein